MKSGTVKRMFPKGIVLRGYDPQNPTGLTLSNPVQRDATGALVDIRQGMIVALGAGGHTWTRGVQAGAATHPTLGFATRDSDDLDIPAADRLTACLLRGYYRVATPYFVRFACTGTVAAPVIGAAYNYAVDTPLTIAAADEIAPLYMRNDEGTYGVWAESAAGYVRPAKTGERIIGRVVARKGDMAPLGVNAATPEAYLPTGGAIYAARQSWTTSVDSSAHIDGSYFLEFDADDHGIVMA